MTRPVLPALLLTLACNGKEPEDSGVAGDADTDTDTDADTDTDVTGLAHTLFVATATEVLSYDIASGAQRAGSIGGIAAPTDLQALDDGTVALHLTDAGEVLAFDGEAMAEAARVGSSTLGATRPVHAYLSPTRNGHRYWIALNDGTGTAETNSAGFVGAEPGSDDFLTLAGEFPLGVGHHKAAFSATQERAVFTNLADCSDVLTVVDYADRANLTALATLDAAGAGMDGSSFGLTCDPTYATGVPPSPGGCTTATHSGKVYCGIGATGQVAVVDVDADPPGFTFVQASGSGGGAMTHHADGRFVYMLQDKPREGDAFFPGDFCQIGQMVAIDTEDDTVTAEIPLFYDGPACVRPLFGTDEESTEGNRWIPHPDGTKVFLQLAGGFGVADARIRREIVVDVSDPGNPVQLDSPATGTSTGFHGDTLSGDGRWLFVANNLDNSVTQIDAATLEVVATIPVPGGAQTVATWGTSEGPGYQNGAIDE